MGKVLRNSILFFIVVTFCINGFCCFASNDASSDNVAVNPLGEYSLNTFADYLKVYKSAPEPQSQINIDIHRFTCTENNAIISSDVSFENVSAVDTSDTGSITWEFNVSQDGLYSLNVDYYTTIGKGSAIARKILIDSSVPFSEARNVMFSRIFKNSTSEIQKDQKGNDIRPEQVEVTKWCNTDLYDVFGYYNMPLQFYLSAGAHTLTFESIKEPMTIGAVKFYQAETPKNYSELSSSYDTESNQKLQNYSKHIQGETADFKSDSMIYPINDNSSPATEPSSASQQLLNTIGGTKWQNYGQWVEWNINVPSDGFYQIAIKARQNLIAGQASYRKMYIDDKMPFSELKEIKFEYTSDWKMVVLSDSKNSPYQFYLKKGQHKIRLEVTLGELAELVQKVNQSISRLTTIYRHFLMVIGQNADTSRDYQFDKILPNDIAGLKTEAEFLESIYNEFKAVNKSGGNQSLILANMIKIIKEMNRKPDKIAKLFSDFSINISSLGTWYTTAQKMPLEIDYIQIASPDVKISKPGSSFFSEIGFALNQFISSFFIDYSLASGDSAKDSIKVWVSSGTDQAKSISQLSKNDFTSVKGIGVNLQLVSVGTLLTATLAHKGPDVALSVAQSEPMNYAIRGAVVDITQFDDYKDVITRFQPSAMTPLTFDGKIYGLPETQSFYMMFYRQDILDQLKISVPQTWEDVIAMLPILQNKNLNFGLPAPFGAGMPIYGMFLYQKGGSLYNEDGSKTKLDSVAASDAFYDWTSYYTNYTLPTQYDFNTRFRSGEIPIGIMDYGTYNALSVFAPELEGIWKMTLVPGTRKEDGTIDRSLASTVSACIIMNDAKDKKKCWEFLKWWTSATAQEKYGKDLESILGTSGRYQTANIEALYQIPWKTEDFNTLMEQWKWTKGIPEVPGSYMTARYIDFAFKQVILDDSTDPGKALQNNNKLINNEITAKRMEFGLLDS